MTIKKTQNCITKPMSATQIINTAWKLYLSNFGIIFLTSLITTIVPFSFILIKLKYENLPALISIIYRLAEFPLEIIVLLSLGVYLISSITFIPFDTFINGKILEKNWFIKSYNNLTYLNFALIMFLSIIEIVVITIINGLIYAFILFITSTTIASIYGLQSGILKETLISISIIIWAIFSFLYLIFYTGQIGICLFQTPILCHKKINFIPLTLEALKIATKNIFHYFIFILLLTSLCGTLGINLYIVSNVIIVLCGFITSNYIAIWVDTISIIITIAFISPMIIGSITLYYYNNKAITEGYDLKIALEEENKIKETI